jgi:uncharacterized protein YodC (DUF2158 family)
MAASFKIGDVVELNKPNPSGPVKALSVNQEGDIQYLVSYVDANGVEQERWFKEDELNKV